MNSPTPWKIKRCVDVVNLHKIRIADVDGENILTMWHGHFNEYATCMPDAEYIVEAANNYESQKRRIAELELFIMNAHTDLKQMRRIEMDEVINDIIVGAERIMKEVQDDNK